MIPNKRRFVIRVQGKDLQSIVRQINTALAQIEERLAGPDAVGQNHDMKGKKLINLGNLKGIASFPTTSTPSNDELRDKINEILGAL